MNDIKDQFVSYKIGVDSLWTNQQTGLGMSTSFPLGTAGQTAQGSTSIIPVLQPVGSSGTLAINQRTTTPENFTISSASYITNTNSVMSRSSLPITTSLNTTVYPNAPSSLLINFSTTNANWNNTAPGKCPDPRNGWNAAINITPDISDCLSYPTFPNGTVTTYSEQ